MAVINESKQVCNIKTAQLAYFQVSAQILSCSEAASSLMNDLSTRLAVRLYKIWIKAWKDTGVTPHSHTSLIVLSSRPYSAFVMHSFSISLALSCESKFITYVT